MLTRNITWKKIFLSPAFGYALNICCACLPVGKSHSFATGNSMQQNKAFGKFVLYTPLAVIWTV